MIIQKTTNLLVYIILSAFIPGCANTPALFNSTDTIEETQNLQTSLHDIYSNLGKDGKVFTFNPKFSDIKIYAFRGGKATTLGHNHVLSSRQFTGFAYLPDKDLANARFDLEFRMDQLEFENIPDNSKLGEAFASQLSSDEIKRTRDHMLSGDNFQADHFPFLRIHSVRVAGEIPKLAVEIQVEMHGQKQNMLIPLTVEVLPNRLTATGAFVLRQSDFGVKPYSVLGGFLAMQNEVVIEFTLVGS